MDQEIIEFLNSINGLRVTLNEKVREEGDSRLWDEILLEYKPSYHLGDYIIALKDSHLHGTP